MKIVIISGSCRHESESSKVSDYLRKQLLTKNSGLTASLLDLSKIKVPMWDEAVRETPNRWNENWNFVSRELASCDGLILVVPEWGGMVPPHVKNILLLASNFHLGNKPGLIVATSASVGGANPISELRVSGYKNNHICWIPQHIIIRNVGEFNKEDIENDFKSSLKKRIESTIGVFLSFSKALQKVREDHLQDLQQYPFGF